MMRAWGMEYRSRITGLSLSAGGAPPPAVQVQLQPEQTDKTKAYPARGGNPVVVVSCF